MYRSFCLLALFLGQIATALSQQTTQVVRGTVVDIESKNPLTGASVIWFGPKGKRASFTDQDGRFRLDAIPVGRQTFEVSLIGYEPLVLQQIDVKSGKELVLNLELSESIQKVEKTVVTATRKSNTPLNEMATLSARSFSVEETNRYAAAAFDPARMAQNYAGVTSGGDDMFNEIVVRGNSPKGMLWRLEGVEIPNPNHFSGGAGQGGAISMLSSSTLATSDFYTGAFPAEYGNALSGVFDLRMRRGNNEKVEGAFMIGALGLEASLEGPFKKGYRGSYLFNYRYSTLDFLNKVGLSPTGDLVPKYQDLSFNIFLPTDNLGDFGIFGLGGSNDATYYSEFNPRDTSLEERDAYEGFTEQQQLGTVGVRHLVRPDEQSYFKTVISASSDQFTSNSEELKVVGDRAERYIDFRAQNTSTAYRLSTLYNRKVNAANTMRFGLIASRVGYNFGTFYYSLKEDTTYRIFQSANHSYLMQGYAQWKHKPSNRWTLNGGFHYTYLHSSGAMSLEPRFAASYRLNRRSRVSLSVGKHSKTEHLALYFYENQAEGMPVNRPNQNLKLTQAWHFVAAYDRQLNHGIRFKSEAYWQHLFNVPVSNDPNSIHSILNASSMWDVVFSDFNSSDTFVNRGTGRNLGIDLTLERSLSDNYYYLITGTLFHSTYTTGHGKRYHTRYDGRYQVNVVGGKEWPLSKNRRFGINLKTNVFGGNRYTPFKVSESIERGEGVLDISQPYGAQVPDYFRFDMGLSYKVNRKRVTHSIMLDVQNITNRQNPGGVYWDSDRNQEDFWSMTGLFPFFNYRIEF
jgi:hypothetical protein